MRTAASTPTGESGGGVELGASIVVPPPLAMQGESNRRPAARQLAPAAKRRHGRWTVWPARGRAAGALLSRAPAGAAAAVRARLVGVTARARASGLPRAARGERGPRIGQGRQRGFELVAQRLVAQWQREPLTEVLSGLIDSEAGADGRDLKQHAARLAEVDRAEVVAVDDGCRAGARLRHQRVPPLVILHARGERDVVHGARSLAREGARRRGIVVVEALSPLAAHEPLSVVVAGEAQCVSQQPRARRRLRSIGPHAVEAGQRVLTRYLGRGGAQRLVVARGDRELMLEALGVSEAQSAAGGLHAHAMRAQALLPELQCRLGGHAPADPVHHPGTGFAARRTGILEERQVRPRGAALVAVG